MDELISTFVASVEAAELDSVSLRPEVVSTPASDEEVDSSSVDDVSSASVTSIVAVLLDPPSPGAEVE